MSVAIGMAQPSDGPTRRRSPPGRAAAGTSIPPMAAATGRAAVCRSRRSPTTISRLISRPTTKKKSAMSPSLTAVAQVRSRGRGQLSVPQVLVPRGRDVGPHQGGDGGGGEDDAAEHFDVDEVAAEGRQPIAAWAPGSGACRTWQPGIAASGVVEGVRRCCSRRSRWCSMAAVARWVTSRVASLSGSARAALRRPPSTSRSRATASGLTGMPRRHERHSRPPDPRSKATSGVSSPQAAQSSTSGRTPSAASSLSRKAGTTRAAAGAGQRAERPEQELVEPGVGLVLLADLVGRLEHDLGARPAGRGRHGWPGSGRPTRPG